MTFPRFDDICLIFEKALYIWLLIVWDQMTFQTFDAICLIFEEALYIWLLIVWDQMTFQTFDAICLIFEEALYIWSPIVCFFIKFKTIGLKLFVGQKELLSIPSHVSCKFENKAINFNNINRFYRLCYLLETLNIQYNQCQL